jgi:hypothetical protein
MNIESMRVCLALGLAAAVSVPSVAYAANKALIIGTTSYASEQNNLPGIDLDIAEMERVARKLGFSKDNIRTLKGKEVTLGNIKYHFESFLAKDVAPNDTVMIYYSGHGVQVPDKNGDESDGADEAISLYNLSAVYDDSVEGGIAWNGVLVDDQLADLLGSLVSDNVIVIVDACHSGTITRSFTGTAAAKTLAYGTDTFAVKSLGASRVVSRSLTGSDESVVDENVSGVITLSAAQDHQKALASSKGSLFTLAVAESLESQRGTASPQSIVSAATNILDNRLDDDLVYQPNLTGDESLFTKPIVLTDAAGRGEVNQADLMLLASEVSPLTVTTTRVRYISEERIDVAVDVPTDGYLNIIAIDSKDEMVVLFPNGLDTDNKVEAGEQSFPGRRSFKWAAQPPWGNTMLTVLFSQAPFSLYGSSLQRTVDGQALADYVLPSLAGFKDFRESDGSKAAGIAFVKTCSSSDVCN